MGRNTQSLLYDRYSILHIERTNSFNKVLFALDTYQDPPRNCAIKMFQPTGDKFQIVKWIEKEFSIEAKRLKQMSLVHPCLPEIYTYFSDSQSYYIVRELIEGKNLEEEVRDMGRFSVTRVRNILMQLLSVLDYIHKQGVIHQNIKPKNIILRQEDSVPMPINFGSIKQIAATYGLYGQKPIFSANNIYGYAPPEQALGKPVPATDIYSLGLTAIYLLTEKNPVDLPTKYNSSSFKIPATIASLDLNLARVLARAIAPDIKDRYSSAREMLDDLSTTNFVGSSQKIARHDNIKKSIVPIKSDRNRQQESNWWKIIMYLTAGMYIAGSALVVWYDWNLNQNTFVPELPEPPTSLPPISTPQQAIPDRSSMLNRQSENSVEIPIFPVGTSKEQLRKALGEPNAIQKGYWKNSSAWIYKNRANNSIDMGYLFDLDTARLRQTEVAIAPSVGLEITHDVLNSLLKGNITPSISQALGNVYRQQTNNYQSSLENLRLSIEREKDGHIYLGVWESDFH